MRSSCARCSSWWRSSARGESVSSDASPHRSRSKFAATDKPAREPSAARALALRLGRGLHMPRRGRILAGKLVVGGAGGLLLSQPLQRHGKLQQALRRLGAFGVGLIALEEGSGGGAVLAAHVERFAEPVLSVA